MLLVLGSGRELVTTCPRERGGDLCASQMCLHRGHGETLTPSRPWTWLWATRVDWDASLLCWWRTLLVRSINLQIPLGASLPRLYILSPQRRRKRLRERERVSNPELSQLPRSLGNEIYSVS